MDFVFQRELCETTRQLSEQVKYLVVILDWKAF